MPRFRLHALALAVAFVALAARADAQPVLDFVTFDGVDYIRWAAAPQSGVDLPWFAIGGITLGNVDAVVAAGARRICVVSAILNAPDVAQACGQFRARLG